MPPTLSLPLDVRSVIQPTNNRRGSLCLKQFCQVCQIPPPPHDTLVHTLYLPPVQLFMLDPNFPPSHTHLTSLSFSKGQCYWSGVCVCVCVF